MNAAGSIPCPDCGRTFTAQSSYTSHLYRHHGKPIPESVTHGTASTYVNYGCRCDECKVARRNAKRRDVNPGRASATVPYAAPSRDDEVLLSCRCGRRWTRARLADVWDGRVPALDCDCENEAAA